MKDFESREALLVWIINFLAREFTNQAVLKGGMTLRLLDCPRYTNDADYVFVPYKSKKPIKELVLVKLNSVPGLKATVTANSKCLHYEVDYGGQSASIEINVALDCKTTEITSADLSRKYNQMGNIIRIMDYATSLSHKLAAWNERRLVRDLYDAWFLFIVIDVKPNIQVLINRLKKIESRLNPKLKSLTLISFCEMLSEAVKILTQEKIEEELKDILVQSELTGMELRLRTGINRLSQYLGNTDI